MSIVPYNTNNQILYHDPNYGIVVVYNNQQSTISMLSTSEAGQSTPAITERAHSFKGNDQYRRYPPYTCPNCGFLWAKSGERRGSDESNNSLAHQPSVEPFESRPSGFGGVGPRFMRHDYFKLLGTLPGIAENEQTKSSLHKKLHQALPPDIFNQGYFKRFFKKVPPYTLGAGAHSQVYKVHHVLNDIKLGTYAVKRIGVGNKFELLESVLNEVLILYELSVKGANHNLIRYNHVWLELGDIEDSNTYYLPESGATKKGSNQIPYMFILQQYCGGGHLEDLIVQNFKIESRLSWKEKVQRERMKRRKSHRKDVAETSEGRNWLSSLEIWKFFTDVVNGVDYLHIHGILHRDLKPSNCLLDTIYDPYTELIQPVDQPSFEHEVAKLPTVLVSDFGEGKFIDKHSMPDQGISVNLGSESRNGNTGTLEYTAPELWLYSSTMGKNKYINEFTYESDIYSLGLILCYLCVGSLPFSEMIVDNTDPPKVRKTIIDWYFSLTFDQFNTWFTGQCSVVGLDHCVEDYSALVYSMIKGEGTRPSTAQILSVLHQIKHSRLINTTEDFPIDPLTSIINNESHESLDQYDGTDLDLTSMTSDNEFSPEPNSPTYPSPKSPSQSFWLDQVLSFQTQVAVIYFACYIALESIGYYRTMTLPALLIKYLTLILLGLHYTSLGNQSRVFTLALACLPIVASVVMYYVSAPF